MRICDFDTNYSPTGGGVRTYHERKLDYYRAHPSVACALVVPWHCQEKRTDGNITVYHVPGWPLLQSGYRFWTRREPLAAVLDDFRPDLVEMGAAYGLPWLLRALLEARSVASVGFYHADYPDVYVRASLRALGPQIASAAAAGARRHAKWSYGWMSAVFGASAYSVSQLRSFGLTRVFRTPLGFEPAMYSTSRRSATLRARYGAADRRLILFSGRLTSEKGIDTLMKAYPLFRDPTRCSLVIEGKGPAERRVRDFARGFAEVHVIGRLADRAELAEHYASADLYLSLGAHETFSIATLEAFASGTPVVAPDSGAAGELVRDANAGRRFKAHDAEHLARAVRDILKEDLPELGRRAVAFSQAGRTWSAAFDRINGLYARVIEAHRSGRLDELAAAEGLGLLP